MKSAGVPNITGFIGQETDASGVGGVFYWSDEIVGGSTGEGGDFKIYFDASRCSTVFGNSDTVQPSALTCQYYIKY